MTEQAQTTAERIRNLIFDAIQDSPYGDESIVATPLGVTIAAEIDRLTAELAQRTLERDEAREIAKKHEDRFFAAASQAAGALAEVERLRLPAEAWEAQRAQRIAFDKFDGKPTTENRDELTAANKAMLSTDAAARAAKERKP